MNDQLQQALATLLSTTVDAMQTGVSFLQAQLPDVIRQLLVWKATYSIMQCLLSITLVLVALWSLRFYRKPPIVGRDRFGDPEYKTNLVYESHGYVHAGLLGVLAVQTVFMSTAVINFNLDWLQIWLAPKIYLIEYAAHLAK